MSLPFAPDPNDGGVQILRDMFGSVIEHLLAPGGQMANASNLLGAAFSYFNGGVLFFGAILMSFVAILGISNSANDGQVLGKNWSTFYTPLRTFTASALLIPSASGFSGIQIFVLIVALYSSAFATNIWKGVVEFALTKDIANTVATSVADNPKFTQLAVDAMKLQTCAKAVQMGMEVTLGSYKPAPMEIRAIPYVKDLADRRVETVNVFYESPGWTGSAGLCGSISFSTTTLKDSAKKTQNVYMATVESTAEVETQVHEAVSQVRRKYILGLFGIGQESPTAAAVDQVLAAAASSGAEGTVDSEALRNALAARQADFVSEVRQAVLYHMNTKNTGLQAALTSGGWVYAGAWQRELARIKDSVRTASAVDYEYNANRDGISTVLSGPVLTSVKTVTDSVSHIVTPLLKKSVYGLEVETGSVTMPKVPTLRTDFSASDFADGGTSVQEHIKTYFNRSFTEGAVTWMATYLGRDGADPIMQIKDMGDWLIVGVETYYVGKAALKITLAALRAGVQSATNDMVTGKLAAPVAAALEAAWQALGEFAAMASIPMGALIYLGYFMSIWIPMIPAFIYLIGVVGWIIAVAEAVIASSLWAVMHITPSKDDSFIGSQSQGYLLLMSVFFRPALMVMGLVLSMVAMIPLIQYTNTFFVLSFRLVQANSVTGLFSIAGFMLAYCFVIFSVLMLIFGLPQTLPDRVLRWAGGGIGDMGEQSSMSKIEGGASSQARMAATAIGARGAAMRQQKIAAEDKGLQTEQNKLIKQQNELLHTSLDSHTGGPQGHQPEGHSGQGVVPPPPPPPEG